MNYKKLFIREMGREIDKRGRKRRMGMGIINEKGEMGKRNGRLFRSRGC